MRLGWRSSTGDAEGVLSEAGEPGFTDAELAAAIQAFTGEIEQLPPMYSAVKVNGERLYKLARKGVVAERNPRRVHIHHLEVVARSATDLSISVTCSKGTYIRTIAEEQGAALGVGAHVTALHRCAAGPFDESDLVSLEYLKNLRPPRRHGGAPGRPGAVHGDFG